jgi:probable addiction module antidote protein
MNTIFVGGSRHVSRLPPEVKKRLDNVVVSGHQVFVGDANGADKAVQKHLHDKQYDKVVVFCTGDTPRNNLGAWRTRAVDAPKSAKGFHFYAAKDREMAREADFGLMIWDGKSPGTILNVMRLATAGKIAVLFNVPDKDVVNIKTLETWKTFFSHCERALQIDVKERATPDEWRLAEADDQPSFLPSLDTPQAAHGATPEPPPKDVAAAEIDQIIATLNRALADGDATAITNTLGLIARERGMSHVARETGLARESLYRALDAKGNPEFATVLKVLASIGLRLEAKAEDAGAAPERATAAG